jgi:DtxR family transcriptional regulator, Mn-dependent transcriptional regulator
MEKVITPGIEEYLEALFHLQEEGKAISTKALAEKLSLKPASVSEMVKKLAAQRLVKHKPYRGVTLTKNGHKAAASLVRRHRLSERFLADMLGVPWDELHDEACKFEHVISDKVEEKLLEALGNPDTCPHGNPIPTADGEIAVETARSLVELTASATGKISKITNESPEFLQYLADLGLMPDVDVVVEEVAPFGGPIIVKAHGAKYALGRQVAEHIYIKLGDGKRA